MAALLESRLLVVLLAGILAFGSAALTGAALEHQRPTPQTSAQGSDCPLANGIQHVVSVQFDGLNLARTFPNLPSDLEQMPHLVDFLQANGTLLTGNHSVLVSNPGGDALTALTGLYPDHHGGPLAGPWRYFNPNGSMAGARGLTYWTSRVRDSGTPAPSDANYNLLSSLGRNLPAPWVPFTRAGCNVGAVGGQTGMVLQDTAADVGQVFGTDSQEAREATAQPAAAAAEYLGLAIHCAAESQLCAEQSGGRPDLLPDEPGGYQGFNALYGQRYVEPQIAPGGGLADLGGSRIEGFPGSASLTPAVSLAYVAAMQEHGVPVTYAYVASPHSSAGGGQLRPGEAAYVRQLRDYDSAFGRFMERLAADGLNQSNTLFVLAGDEGEDFVGTPPSPAGCDGGAAPCTYAQAGRVRVDLSALLAAQNVSTPFAVQEGSAAAVWVAGDPGPATAAVRSVERAAGGLFVRDPYSGLVQAPVRYLADRAEMRLLHMVSADPARTPSFVLYTSGKYLLSAGPGGCPAAGCSWLDPRIEYSQGGVDPEQAGTWLGVAGPGVARRGRDGATWADQADVRPTLLALVGLHDRYQHDGRVLSQLLQPAALPAGLRGSQAAYEGLAVRLKQLDAPAGRVGVTSLTVSSSAITSAAVGDVDYRSYETRMEGFTQRRDATAEGILATLEAAAFEARPIDARTAAVLDQSADQLLAEIARA